AVFAWLVGGDRVGRAPLREARTEYAVLLEPVAQPVEAVGDRLAVGQRQRLCARIDLDSRNDPSALQQLRERRPVRGRLADRLVVEDYAGDEFFGALGREEQLAVGAP